MINKNKKNDHVLLVYNERETVLVSIAGQTNNQYGSYGYIYRASFATNNKSSLEFNLDQNPQNSRGKKK